MYGVLVQQDWGWVARIQSLLLLVEEKVYARSVLGES